MKMKIINYIYFNTQDHSKYVIIIDQHHNMKLHRMALIIRTIIHNLLKNIIHIKILYSSL